MLKLTDKINLSKCSLNLSEQHNWNETKFILIVYQTYFILKSSGCYKKKLFKTDMCSNVFKRFRLLEFW